MKLEYAPIIGFKHLDLGFKYSDMETDTPQIAWDAMRVLSKNQRLQYFKLVVFKATDYSTKLWLAANFDTGKPFMPLILGRKKDAVVLDALRHLSAKSKDDILKSVGKYRQINTEGQVRYTKRQERKYCSWRIYPWLSGSQL